ncbi:MAG: efflux transporter outer membrane subunit [Pseudomonadota bacterium]|nr:efflux transporter outer membrane subunit [Pseudomonadota bacterium]
MSWRRVCWVAILPLLSLTACSLQPVYERPPLPVPAALPEGGVYALAGAVAPPVVRYQDVYTDPRLQKLVERALLNNRDLRTAAANIERTRALYRIQRAALLPEVDANAGVSRIDRGTARGGTSGAATTSNTYSVDVGSTAFELDLFGRVRSLGDAALNRYFATDAAAQSTRLALVGDIGVAWLTYASDSSLLAIAERTAESAGRSVELTRRRLQGGVAPRIDVRQAELVLATAQSDVARQRTALAQDVNALQLLLGEPVDPALLPGSIDSAADTLADLPSGLDSAVLLRRPDVAQAEYNLRAANADIGAARAALFPRVSLTAVVGFASNTLGSLFSSGAFNYQLGPGIRYPIFQAGAGLANVEASRAQRDGLVASYERSIQNAFRDVADALARRGTIDEQLAASRRLVEASQDNFRLADARYRNGVANFLQSLDAQRSLYTAERTLAQTRLTQGLNRVAVYRALGGDTLGEAVNRAVSTP